MVEAARLAGERGAPAGLRRPRRRRLRRLARPRPRPLRHPPPGPRRRVRRLSPRPSPRPVPQDARRESAPWPTTPSACATSRAGRSRGLRVCTTPSVAAALATPQPIPLTLPRRRGARRRAPPPRGPRRVLPEPPFLRRRLGGCAAGGLPRRPRTRARPPAAGRTSAPSACSRRAGGRPDRCRAAGARGHRGAAGRAAARTGAGRSTVARCSGRSGRGWEASLAGGSTRRAREAGSGGTSPGTHGNLAACRALLPDLYDLVGGRPRLRVRQLRLGAAPPGLRLPRPGRAPPTCPPPRSAPSTCGGPAPAAPAAAPAGAQAARARRPAAPPPPGERFPGEWLAGFDESAICSYPPEDIVVEEFGRYLKRRGEVDPLRGAGAHRALHDLRARRHRPPGDAAPRGRPAASWVRELGRVPGEVGPVVVVFEDERLGKGDQRFPYALTWMGEHAQESDMAFYAPTRPRGSWGRGSAASPTAASCCPTRRAAWPRSGATPTTGSRRRKAEVLLLAALDYAQERIVVHVGARPPRGIFRHARRPARPEDPARAPGDALPQHAAPPARDARPVRAPEARHRQGLRLVAFSLPETASATYDDCPPADLRQGRSQCP